MEYRPRPALRAGLLGLFLVLLAPPAADAQLFGWFGNLFGGNKPASAPEDGVRQAPRRNKPVRRKAPESVPDQASRPATQQKPTVFVDVFGDTFGQLLANGLDDALSDRPDIGIVHLGRGASGLVNTGYYDWPKSIDDLLSKQSRGEHKEEKGASPTTDKKESVPERQIDVAVMMIGSNDRQPIYDKGKRLESGSAEWTAAYRARVLAIAEAFAARKVPLIWVGLPIVKNDEMADDIAALNDVYREIAARTGATYIDTWEAFADEDGDFVANGPDVNGQTTRLRTGDGIYFTKAGARKLAHFVEGHVRRLIEGRTPAPSLPTNDAAGAPKPGVASIAAPRPEAGPIRVLGETPAARDGRLIDLRDVKVETTHDPAVVNALVKGHTAPAPIGRADNFHWSQDRKVGAD